MTNKKDDVDEASWSNAKMAQSHGAHDAWKDAQKLAHSSSSTKPDQWKKDKEHTFEPKNGDLKLAKEMGVAGIAGVQAPGKAPMTEEEFIEAVRALVRHRVKEVVRKKAGGGGYSLYSPNPGKKGNAKAVGTFPTRAMAKRAELARFPPKDPAKLARLRREVQKLTKKGDKKDKDKPKHKKPHKESLVREGTPFSSSGSTPTTSSQPIHKDMKSFMSGLQAIPKTDAAKRGQYVQAHISSPDFVKALQTHEPDQNKRQGIMKSLYKIADDGARMGAAGQKLTVGGESTDRAKMEAKVIATIIKKSLVESLFREEKTESDWDQYISKLSKAAMNGDSKFQNLQKNITRKTSDVLEDAFDSIRKAVGKSARLKNFGIKHDDSSGKTYLAFGADFDDLSVEPICIYVEGGVPKIELTTNAKVALTKLDPTEAKMFRAELVTVQERVLDNVDDLTKAVQNRDKYLSKMEQDVDTYVAELTPLQVSLLKNLLIKKYRKIS